MADIAKSISELCPGTGLTVPPRHWTEPLELVRSRGECTVCGELVERDERGALIEHERPTGRAPADDASRGVSGPA